MKRWKSVPAVLLSVCSLLACSKSSTESIAGSPDESEAAKSLIRQPAIRIKTMYNQYDTTRFFYNQEGALDSVTTKYELYRMFGKGKYVDSMAYYWGGTLETTYSNIRYNEAGRMTEFTSTRQRSSVIRPFRYILEYDQRGDIIAQRMEVRDDRKLENFYRYNQEHDLVWNNLAIEGAGDYISTVKTDGHPNPFYKMDLLYIIFGGGEMQQMILCKHNLSEVFRETDNTLLTFRNEYDNEGRLIKKTNLYYDESFNLTYY